MPVEKTLLSKDQLKLTIDWMKYLEISTINTI